MKFITKALFLSASVLAAAPASAATLVYNFSSSNTVLRLFDPALGSLTAATFDVMFNITAYTTRSNPTLQSALNGEATGLGAFGLSNIGSLPTLTNLPLRGPSMFSPGSSGGYCQVSGTGSSVITGSGLADLTGTGTITTQGGGTLTRCDFAAAPLIPTSVNYFGTVTYTYTAAVVPSVPEATTWAMMLVGFGLVGGALRRRRVVVAFA